MVKNLKITVALLLFIITIVVFRHRLSHYYHATVT